MGLWLALGSMTLIALALVAAPLLRGGQVAATRRDYDLRVYRAQLAELARERDRGLLGERETAAARLEVERRMLAADAADRKPARTEVAGRRSWPIALVLLIALPALAGSLYWRLGSPVQPGAPFAERGEERLQMAEAEARRREALPSVETMIERLEQRLATDPDDLDARRRLGNAYALTRRFEQSAETYRQAIARHEGIAELHAALGEALVMAEDGVVGPEARAAFDKALELEPDDPRARYYSGLALLQRGEQQAALDAWAALIADTRADAPWLADLRRQATALAEELGLDPQQTLPAPRPGTTAGAALEQARPRGPTAEQMRAAESMPAEDREQMVRDMAAGLAARLEAQPDDLEGWRMLGRSWTVLGEREKAAQAYAQVATRLPDDLTVQIDYVRALLALEPVDALPSPEVVTQLRKVLQLDPDNPEALFHLGRAAAAQGDAPAAARHWRRLLAQLPPDSPERAAIQGLLQNLETDG
jgi:cytochrome c-type biogenesis protein CcmH